jgi:hypothetical protein
MLSKFFMSLCIVFITFFLSAQKVKVKTYGIYAEKKEFILKDSIFMEKSIVFFLPIKNYDTTFWNLAIANFLTSFELGNSGDLIIQKVFFEPGICNHCGLKFKNHLDSVDYIYYPSCFITGFDQKLATRALKLRSMTSFRINVVNPQFPIAQIIFQNSAKCMYKPNGEADLDAWKPFLNEVFYPKYTIEEKVIRLQLDYDLLKTDFNDLREKYNSLEKELTDLKNVPEQKETEVQKRKGFFCRSRNRMRALEKNENETGHPIN